MTQDTVVEQNGTTAPASAVAEEPAAAPAAPKMDFFEFVTSPPDWLTQDFFEAKVLQSYEKDARLKIQDYSIVPATKPGDNFASIVFRVKVSYLSRGKEHKDVPFILKVEPFLEGAKKEALAGGSLFTTEAAMYMKTLPEMQRLLKNAGDDEIIAPDLVYSNTSPKLLVFKDIAPDHFEMMYTPTDLATSEMVAKKLGKFHGLSYYMMQNGHDLSTYKDGFISDKLAMTLTFMNENFTALGNIMDEWGPEMKPIAEKLRAMRSKMIPRLTEIYQPAPGSAGIRVLNHGDFHNKNMLFRKRAADPNVVEEIRFIDFQLSVYASPAIDLAYLLYAVSGPDGREKRDELIKIYYDEFKSVLGKLGHLKSIPTLLDFQVEVLKNGITELFLASLMLPMFFVDFSKMAEIGDMESEEGKEKFRRLYYLNPEYVKIMKPMLFKFMHKGLLDL